MAYVLKLLNLGMQYDLFGLKFDGGWMQISGSGFNEIRGRNDCL